LPDLKAIAIFHVSHREGGPPICELPEEPADAFVRPGRGRLVAGSLPRAKPYEPEVPRERRYGSRNGIRQWCATASRASAQLGRNAKLAGRSVGGQNVAGFVNVRALGEVGASPGLFN
jgi:hypothetical protein